MPEAKLALDVLGFPGASDAFLKAGISVLTVNFVDAEHLLVTFASRGLVQRIPDADADAQPRMIAAELIELPSGRILARTDWRLPDGGRYLWSLGEGRFLLRDGQTLSTFAPLETLKARGAFSRTVFAHRPGAVHAVVVSSDNQVVTVETSASSKPPIMLDFYRLSGEGSEASPIVLEPAGSVQAQQTLVLPVDGDGYLNSTEPQRGTLWPVTFQTYAGKKLSLGAVDSSCPPGLRRAGPGLVLAVGCRGITGRINLIALDFAKHDIWEESLADSPVPPAFVYAPDAGRFALSRISSAQSATDFNSSADNTASQEVRVYQAQTGDLLLRIASTPVFRTSENFDLSEDGMRAAVVHEGAIEIYRLPKLSGSDMKDLATLQALAPPVGEGLLRLQGLTAPPAADTGERAPLTATDTAGSTVAQTPSPVASAAANEAEANAAGDTQGPRKPPTLLNPGEKAEHPQ